MEVIKGIISDVSHDLEVTTDRGNQTTWEIAKFKLAEQAMVFKSLRRADLNEGDELIVEGKFKRDFFRVQAYRDLTNHNDSYHGRQPTPLFRVMALSFILLGLAGLIGIVFLPNRPYWFILLGIGMGLLLSGVILFHVDKNLRDAIKAIENLR